MASSIRQESSSFGKKAVFSIILCSILFIIPVYLAVNEVERSRDGFSTVTLISHLEVGDDEDMIRRFAAYGYNLTDIKNGQADVPNLFLEELPRELTTLKDADDKKELFIASLLPPILKVNEYILYERSKLLQIIRSIELNGKASNEDLYWLRRKFERYRMGDIRVDNFYGSLDELYKRMNIVPPSLALTQAAIETGWGSSRFAQEANALYGQWTWSDDSGMIPLEREEGAKHSIKIFNNLISAVEGYTLNLNTHPAYEDFRTERAKFPRPEDIVVNDDLLFTLLYYSERGFEYIDNLNNIMRVNGLRSFDNVKLEKNAFQELRLNPAP